MNYVLFQNRLPQVLGPLVLAGALTFGAAAAHGTMSLSITDGVGDPNAISIAPGSSFSITLRLLTTVETPLGLTYYLAARGAGSGKFSIASREASGTLFSEFTSTNVSGVNLTDPNAGGSPAPSRIDLGASYVDFPNGAPAGSQFLANYTVTTINLSPGVYVLDANSDGMVLVPSSTPNDPEHPFDQPSVGSNSYTVTVVPEPGSAALLLGGLGCLGLRRRRS